MCDRLHSFCGNQLTALLTLELLLICLLPLFFLLDSIDFNILLICFAYLPPFISPRCAGRSKCSLEATVASLGEDACPRVHKYLEVHFNCTAPGFRPSSPAVAGSLDSVSSSSGKCPLSLILLTDAFLSLFSFFSYSVFPLTTTLTQHLCSNQC